MKFAVVTLALVAAVNAGYGDSKYNPFSPFNRYNSNPYNDYRYRPYTTPGASRFRPDSVTTPVTVSPTPYFETTPSNYPGKTSIPILFANTSSIIDNGPTTAIIETTPEEELQEVRIVSNESNAEILRYENKINPDGSFRYLFETSNGISAQEQGALRDLGGDPPVESVIAEGSFSWTSPEGVLIELSYIADETGYHPTGNAIPTPPPVPPQIARALEYIAKTSSKD